MFYQFCCSRDVQFPCSRSSVIADFLCHVSDQSERPNSVIKNVCASLSCLFEGIGLPNPINSDLIHLKTGISKAGTSKPRKAVSVMPVAPFKLFFEQWTDHNVLSIKQLRLKCVTLLALALMARPSDLAPKAVQLDPHTLSETKVVFSVHNVQFLDDGSMIVKMFGIKNDTDRSGFTIKIPKGESHVDPVCTLKDYIYRTRHQRPEPEKPIFISLNRPYSALSSQAIADILNESINLVGLTGHGYSAKSFRPTAASASLDIGLMPETAMLIGRWKTKEVFFNHYVYPRAPESYTTELFKHD